MSLRIKLLVAFLVSALVLASVVSALAYLAAVDQQRTNLVHQGELLSIALNEAVQSSRDTDALRIAVEDVTRQSAAIAGISIAGIEPLTVLASSFHPRSVDDHAAGEMLLAVVESGESGRFGFYLAANGDLIVIQPVWAENTEVVQSVLHGSMSGRQEGLLPASVLSPSETTGETLPNDDSTARGPMDDQGRFATGIGVRLPKGSFTGVIYIRFDWATVLAELGASVWRSAWVAGLALSAMLLIAFVWIQSLVLRPLRIIGRGVEEQVAGNLSYRLPALGHDEFGRLANSFNVMLASMMERDERLRGIVEHLPMGLALHGAEGRELLVNRQYERWFAVGLMRVRERLAEPGVRALLEQGEVAHWDHTETDVDGGKRHFSTTAFPVVLSRGEMGTASIDITERKRLERSLIEAKEEAEQANAAKTQFLSNMSHELRTPLNALIGFTELLTLGVEPEEQQVFLGQMDKAGRHLLALVNDVLDLARVEAGRMNLSLEPVSVNAVLAESEGLSQPIANKFGIVLRVNADGEDYRVRADYTRLKQVVLNLVSNAIKYNREHGSVTVFVEPRGAKRLAIVVEDSGHGISPEQQQRLFQPFERLNADENNVEGSGIGLVFSRKLVEAMGGELLMSSVPGTGSRFWVELDRNEDIASEQAGQDEDGPRAMAASAVTKKLLYVEDNSSNMKLVEHIVRKYTPYELIEAPEPRLGLELLAAHSPDLVILDINLPQMSGFELLETIKSFPDFRHTPVIALSANAMPSDIQKGLEAGFDAYLAKPVRVEELLSALRGFLEEA